MTTSIRLNEKLKEQVRKIMPSEKSFSKKINFLIKKGIEKNNTVLEEVFSRPDLRIISQKADFGENLNSREIHYITYGLHDLFDLAQKKANLESSIACANFVNNIFQRDLFPVEEDFQRYLGRNLSTTHYTSIKEGVSNINQEVFSETEKTSSINRNEKAKELLNILNACFEKYPESLSLPFINEIIKEYLPLFLSMLKYKKMITNTSNKPCPHYLSKKRFFNSLNYEDPENVFSSEKYHMCLIVGDTPNLKVNFIERGIIYFFSYLEMIDLFSFAENYEQLLKEGKSYIKMNGEKTNISARNEEGFIHFANFSGVGMFFEPDEMKLFFKSIREFVEKNKTTIKEIKLQIGDF